MKGRPHAFVRFGKKKRKEKLGKDGGQTSGSGPSAIIHRWPANIQELSESLSSTLFSTGRCWNDMKEYKANASIVTIHWPSSMALRDRYQTGLATLFSRPKRLTKRFIGQKKEKTKHGTSCSGTFLSQKNKIPVLDRLDWPVSNLFDWLVNRQVTGGRLVTMATNRSAA